MARLIRGLSMESDLDQNEFLRYLVMSSTGGRTIIEGGIIVISD